VQELDFGARESNSDDNGLDQSRRNYRVQRHRVSTGSTDTCGARGNFCRLWVLLLAPDRTCFIGRGVQSASDHTESRTEQSSRPIIRRRC
jgi:hypothetical protein